MGPLRSIISYAAHAIYHLKAFSIEFLLSLSLSDSVSPYLCLSSSTRSLPSAFKFLNLKRIYRFERYVDRVELEGAWLSGPLTRVKTWTKNNEKCSLLSSAACVGQWERERERALRTRAGTFVPAYSLSSCGERQRRSWSKWERGQ